ncbi:MAG TPA: MFS transporter [Thermoleophilia bacterium]|nr:MFS transporter [Thermoleophilia bacterium]
MIARVRGLAGGLAGYPRQFWVLVLGTFVYCAGAGLAFPLEGIYLRTQLHSSWLSLALVFGLPGVVTAPFQIIGGAMTDRFGRKAMIILASISGTLWFVGFAYATADWQVGALVVMENCLGWPLFLTASNAMVADMLPHERRTEAYSIIRTAMNVGVVLGPAVGGLALALGASFRSMFLAAAAGCLVFLVMVLLWIEETRPATAQEKPKSGQGYGVVVRDRRFVTFLAVALLPLIAFGNFGAVYSAFITTELGVQVSTWPWLLALNAAIVAALQYPVVRRVRGADPMVLLALASALIGIGVGATGFVEPLLPLVLLIVLVSLGELFFSPIASSVVADMAPEAIRGRYMGAWTVAWNGGASFGVIVGGLALQVSSPQVAWGLILVLSLAGAALFGLMSEGRPLQALAPEADATVRDAERPT